MAHRIGYVYAISDLYTTHYNIEYARFDRAFRQGLYGSDHNWRIGFGSRVVP